jgi:hypothetical protein
MNYHGPIGAPSRPPLAEYVRGSSAIAAISLTEAKGVSFGHVM